MKDYLIDTHAHIDMLEEPTNQVLLEMHNFGIKKVIIPSVEISTMQNIVNIANQNENIYAMVGIFPSEAKTYNKDIEEKMKFRRHAENLEIYKTERMYDTALAAAENLGSNGIAGAFVGLNAAQPLGNMLG